jgi:hypothetical protein
MKIQFTNLPDIPEEFIPVPAKSLLPDWYKNMESYMGGVRKPNGEGVTSGTIKRCFPVFDAIASGYLILTPADIFVSQQDGVPYYEWAAHNLITLHPIEQAPNHPLRNGMPSYPKITNPWSIKTPKGYSCLFTAPKHRDNPIVILDAIVDTDAYTAPVNFPFILKDSSFEGLIPAGTPVAQVLPFKRDSFTMVIGKDKNRKEELSFNNNFRVRFFDSYKKYYWHHKEYK